MNIHMTGAVVVVGSVVVVVIGVVVVVVVVVVVGVPVRIQVTYHAPHLTVYYSSTQLTYRMRGITKIPLQHVAY